MRDSKNVTAVCDLPDTQEQRDALLAQWREDLPKVRKVIAQTVVRNGEDKEVMEEMLKMLGIHPEDGDDPLLINTGLGAGAALKDFNR